jgi:hypothetical protein
LRRAIALGWCGFLEEGRKKGWEDSSYYLHLRSLWHQTKCRVNHQFHLKLDHIRPLNHPVRRLSYLAHFLQDPSLEELWSSTLRIWNGAMGESNISNNQLKENLLNVIPHYHDAYWDYHYTFESQSRRQKVPCLGKDLKLHILLNTTLPLLHATIKDVKIAERFQQFYASLKMPQISKSRYLHQRFFGHQKSEGFLEQAQLAQGA